MSSKNIYFPTSTDRSAVVKSGELDTSELVFVAKAISTDESRYFMCVMHIERDGDDMVAIGTDGRRLHYATLADEGYQEGDYQVAKATKNSIVLTPVDTGGTYPNWRRVIPTDVLDYHNEFLARGADSDISISDKPSQRQADIARFIAIHALFFEERRKIAREQDTDRTHLYDRRCISADFVADLAGHAWYMAMVTDRSGFGTVVLTSNRKKAVIAPMAID